MPIPQQHLTPTSPHATEDHTVADRVFLLAAGVAAAASVVVVAGVLALAAGVGGEAFAIVHVAITIGAVVIGASTSAALTVRLAGMRRARPARLRRSRIPQAVRLAARMAPAARRNELLEEWAAWLLDMRLRGEPWWQRLLEVLSIVLVAAPGKAVALRLGPSRAADR